MYRDNYSEQPMASTMPNMNNSSMPNYDFRNSPYIYKPNNPIDGMMPSHQSHGMYYDNQNMPQMEQNPYMNMMPVQPIQQGYEHPSRYYWRQMEPKHSENYPSMPPPTQYPPQMNIVQRISGIIKSQLPMLQAIMSQIPSKYNSRVQIPTKRHHSRSRSRSRDKNRKNSDSTHDWLCRKCSFSNFDWRQSCKKCNEPRVSRSFVPGPEDWKCPKCGNINYARRHECNRCKQPKLGSD